MDVAEALRVEPGCQRRLVYVLFVWVTILSLGLAVTLALVLVLTARTPPPPPPPPPPIKNLPLGYVRSQEITMKTGKSSEKKDVIPWDAGEPGDVINEEPLDVQREHLMVKDGWGGRYFLYVQVTLQSGKTPKVAPMVRVKRGDTTLLESVLANGIDGALTTGFLGRRVDLYANENITVSCSNACYINTTNTATYLGVYLLKRD